MAQVVNDVEPAVAAFEAKAHADSGRVAVVVTEYVGAAVGEEFVEFLLHSMFALPAEHAYDHTEYDTNARPNFDNKYK